jgi:NAD(P)-dependent dehydrogenase (short-subunit alcohol dehydrogenase family)
MSELSGRAAVVTGGAHGIGRAVVERLLSEGAGVVVLDAELPGELGHAGPRLACVAGDVRRRADVRAAAALAVERFGGVDVVVAVAGVGALQPLLEIDDESWQRMIDINLTGVFLTVQEGARAMVDSGRAGTIVVVSSTNAVYAEESTVHYTASKGALVALVRAASLDLARYGIRINAVAPGMVRTRMAAPLTNDAEASAEFLRNVPLGHFAEPEDIAAVVRFLASGESRYVTGSLVVADGGLTVGMTLGTDEIGAG